MTDAVELMDCSDYEEDTDLPDAEAPFLADRTTVQDTYQLLDFIVMTTDKKKHSKPGRKKPHWCTDVLTLDVEEDKDRDIIYVDKEDYQIQGNYLSRICLLTSYLSFLHVHRMFNCVHVELISAV